MSTLCFFILSKRAKLDFEKHSHELLQGKKVLNFITDFSNQNFKLFSDALITSIPFLKIALI